MRTRHLIFSSAFAALLLGEHVAQACDPVGNAPCGDLVRIQPNADVPANVPAFHWVSTFPFSDVAKADARLERTDLATPEAVPFHLVPSIGGNWVTFDGPLVPGATYTFRRGLGCAVQTGGQTQETTFKAGAVTALGPSFGVPKVTPAVTKDVTYYGPSQCGLGPERQVQARSVTIAPADNATINPLVGYLPLYGVYIDGKESRVYGNDGAAALELQAYCGTSDDAASSPIAPGKHTAQLYAIYPGTEGNALAPNTKDGIIMSEPVEVDLSCPASIGTGPSPAQSQPAASASSNSSSCAMGRDSSAPVPALALLAGALVIASLRRRSGT